MCQDKKYQFLDGPNAFSLHSKKVIFRKVFLKHKLIICHNYWTSIKPKYLSKPDNIFGIGIWLMLTKLMLKEKREKLIMAWVTITREESSFEAFTGITVWCWIRTKSPASLCRDSSNAVHAFISRHLLSKPIPNSNKLTNSNVTRQITLAAFNIIALMQPSWKNINWSCCAHLQRVLQVTCKYYPFR